MTQLERADAIRAGFKKLFPEIDRLKQELDKLLGEAQNAPPHGEADGTIFDVQYSQLRSIEKAASRLLVSLLFDTRAPQSVESKEEPW